MADYACSITFDTPRPQRISRDLVLITGEANLTNYNTSQSSAEITDITGKFKSTMAVVADGFSEDGYGIYWDRGTKTFKAFYPNTGDSGDEAGSEVSNDVNVGKFNFVAIGLI